MKQFRISPFGSMSAEALKAHLGLYKGYVEQSDAVLKQLNGQAATAPAEVFTPRETLARRLSFEDNGVILHQLFFEQLEHPGKQKDKDFAAALKPRFGSFQKWQDDVMQLGKTRGPGWVLTCLRADGHLVENYWIDLHELGLPAGSAILHVVDLWEHAYWSDYGAKGREKFMDDIFAHTDWSVAGRRLQQAQRRNT